MRIALIAMSSLLVIACKDDEPTPAQTDAPDASGETTPDTTELDDSDTGDDTPDTATDADDDTADSAADTDDSSDADTAETTCEYFEERELLRCGPNDSVTQVLRWVSADAAACPVYYTRGEDRYETIEALATGESCDTSCVFKARSSADFIRCDGLGRSGYDVYEAADETCGTLYYTSDGIFPDRCLWALYACHCEEE